MKLLFHIQIKGEKAVATSLPVVSEGSRGVVYLAPTFDKTWADFSVRKLTLWREGEIMLQFLLEDGIAVPLPSDFTLSEKPFYLRFTGEAGDTCIQTNPLCASFGDLRLEEGKTPAFSVYEGPYRITGNGVYPLESRVLSQDLTVDVPSVDTSGDTVTPETLHKGITAHNAAGKPIVGIFVNPYNADTSGDTVTPETLCRGVTAHNAEGEAILGVYVPGGGNTATSFAKAVVYRALGATGAPRSAFTLKV